MSLPPPSLSPPTLQPFQFSYGGLTFGGVAPGSAYPLIKATGLDLPALRQSDPNRARDEGSWIGLPLLDTRTVAIDLMVLPDGIGSGLAHAKATLAGVMIPSGPRKTVESPLWVNYPGAVTLALMARPTRMSYSLDQTRIAPSASRGAPTRGATTDAGWLPVSLAFVCTDPRAYLAPSQTTTIASGGSATITNAGDMEMRPVLVISGPAGPTISIVNTTLGATLQFSGNVPSGATLTVDLDSHYVIYTAGTLSQVVANALVQGSIWWNLPPGANTINYTGGGSCAVQWASAYGTALA